MSKTGHPRIDDAVTYLKNKGLPWLASKAASTLLAAPNAIATVGEEISLKKSYGGMVQEQALRSLLLCQRVFLSDLSLRPLFMGGMRIPQSALPQDWVNQSLTHWGGKSEAAIYEGIKTFSVRKRTADRAADVAGKMPTKTNNFPLLTLTRQMNPFPIATTLSCYGSVMLWLFQSGIVSYKWYLNNNGACDKANLTDVFALNNQNVTKVLWTANKLFGDKDTLGNIPRGHVVHLYVDNPLRWNGHWLISNGDSSACACNNDTENGRVPNQYCNNASLDKQFLFGYKHPLNGGGFEQGIAEVIDPLKIPNRL